MHHVYDVYQDLDHIQPNFLTRSQHQQSEKVIQKAWQKCNDGWELNCVCSLQAIITCLIKHNTTCVCVCVCARVHMRAWAQMVLE